MSTETTETRLVPLLPSASTERPENPRLNPNRARRSRAAAPDYSVLVSLYDPKTAGFIRNMLDKFFEDNKIVGCSLRKRKEYHREVFTARTNLETNYLFKNIH